MGGCFFVFLFMALAVAERRINQTDLGSASIIKARLVEREEIRAWLNEELKLVLARISTAANWLKKLPDPKPRTTVEFIQLFLSLQERTETFETVPFEPPKTFQEYFDKKFELISLLIQEEQLAVAVIADEEGQEKVAAIAGYWQDPEKQDVVHIGFFVTLPEFRGGNLCAQLMERIVQQATNKHPTATLVLQSRVTSVQNQTVQMGWREMPPEEYQELFPGRGYADRKEKEALGANWQVFYLPRRAILPSK